MAAGNVIKSAQDVHCAERPTSDRPKWPKVWLLTNSPSPYQVELLTATGQLTATDLQVRFMRVPAKSTLETVGPARMSYRKLWGAAPNSWRDEFRLHPRALWEAAFGRFDCYILSGLYTSVTFLCCALILTLRRKPWAVWLERPHVVRYQALSSSGRVGRAIVSAAKFRLLRFLLSSASKVIGIGSAAVQAYRDIGIDDKRLLMLPYCCDVRRFADVDDSRIEAVRHRFRLIEKTVFLFSGQMINRKGVDVVLRSFERLADQRPNVALLLLGDGPQKHEYQQRVPEHMRDRVHFIGFLPQQELPCYFAAADVFVFPSRHDGWGVVINEACAAGLPVIASHQTGAVFDLLADGENGFKIDCENVDAFCDKMMYFVDHPRAISRFGQRSRTLIEEFSVERGAFRFHEHVLATIGTPIT